ncbi:MAG TPA: DUF3185 family protein [Rariglobus sp.]|jgi:hypothetical protein|nr:DUF3185 family protein [Rariglobus sp.]
MNKIIGIILILVGGFLIFKGTTRKDSIVGGAAEVGADVANKVDGGARIPEHYYYIIGGAAVAAAGLGMALRGGSKS